ncbi:MAG: hypothetical protein F6K41_33675 [Symploca sp. SIO3E6]|nr:hypothetical protein [Caldora sp. SIO3E6]
MGIGNWELGIGNCFSRVLPPLASCLLPSAFCLPEIPEVVYRKLMKEL